MNRTDLIDRRALIIADHLGQFRKTVEASPILSEAKAATQAYRASRQLAEALTEEDARIARVQQGATSA